jgi:hypothetical protein
VQVALVRGRRLDRRNLLVGRVVKEVAAFAVTGLQRLISVRPSVCARSKAAEASSISVLA